MDLISKNNKKQIWDKPVLENLSSDQTQGGPEFEFFEDSHGRMQS